MTELHKIFKCELCGNIIQVIHNGDGELVCCNQPMTALSEQTADFKTEKHVPVIEKTESGFKITVGSVPHPMEEKHYIEWIELIADGRHYRKFLKPNDKPEAFFCIDAANVSAREYCNVHKLWKS